ncbi:hypothetical protein [Actinomycetospora sp. NBC_00405]|uniref:hypothetical protein n=1 Tax=Actinomycetospora sp. NBC_00405 TaxID=2975952 RepID=UPI002E1C3C6F
MPDGMPATCSAILGHRDDPDFADRVVDHLDVGWGDATKHRRLAATARGRTVALDLPRGTFLVDGAVLVDDGDVVVAVRRPAEDAIVIPLDELRGPEACRRALLLGHRLGNQHAPLEFVGTELRTPLVTGAPTAEAALAALGLPGGVRRVPLAARGWASTSADHREGHHHG